MTRFYRFALAFLTPLVRFFFRMKVENSRHIPKGRNFIVVCNHISALDPFLVIVSGGFRVRPMAKKELYRPAVVGFLLRKLGCIRVDREDGVRALALAKRSLERGEDMLIFPEGTRSRTRELAGFKPGAAALSVRTGTPLLPCQVIAPKGLGFFRRTVIRYGPVIPPEAVTFPDDRHYERGNGVIRDAFLALRGRDMP